MTKIHMRRTFGRERIAVFMEKEPRKRSVIEHLEAALEAESVSEKNYHVREALQLLDLRNY